jgi:hypothetical protein
VRASIHPTPTLQIRIEAEFRVKEMSEISPGLANYRSRIYLALTTIVVVLSNPSPAIEDVVFSRSVC